MDSIIKNNFNEPIIEDLHPIKTGNYHIVTNEIMNLYAVVNRWIKNRAPGGIIYGKPRLGKTKAIEYLKYYLKEEYGEELPIFTMVCSDHKPNENRFYTNLLREVGHSFYNQGKAEIKKERLIRFFIEKAENNKFRKLILFIDESQMLFEKDYNWLMDIYNQLDRNAITMTVILVGQEELMHQRSSFIAGNKKQIVGRFMIHEYKFSGLKNLDDIKTCLKGYDIYSEYPAHSECCFTKYFFTDAYNDGHRLGEDAELIFNAFQDIRSEFNITSPFEIPMQYFTLSIDNCLNTFGSDGKGVYWPSKMNWHEAIKSSGYVYSEILM